MSNKPDTRPQSGGGAHRVTETIRARSIARYPRLEPSEVDYVRDGAQDDLDVVPERPVGHVQIIDRHHFSQRHTRRAEYLPWPRHSRSQLQASAMPALDAD